MFGLVHPTTGNALLFAAPGALATLDLGLSTASVCTAIGKIALHENGASGFSLITLKVISGFQ